MKYISHLTIIWLFIGWALRGFGLVAVPVWAIVLPALIMLILTFIITLKFKR